MPPRRSRRATGFRGESPALGVGEAQAPTAEMLTQDAVLLLEVRDDLGLVAVHPAREHHEQELQRCDRHRQRSDRAEPGAVGVQPRTVSRKA